MENYYALGWALAGIYAHDELKDTWIFKGGTCLKKCFFETYRFSEDLDFTLTEPEHLDIGFLERVFGEISEWIYDAAGLEFPVDGRASLPTNCRRCRHRGAARLDGSEAYGRR